VTIDTTNNVFLPWSAVQKEFTFNPRMSFDEIVVPTEDSTKYIEISSSLLKSH
jgi:dynein heavy chain